MYETKQNTERKVKPQTQKLIGKIVLKQYGNFIDNYNKELSLFRNKIDSTINEANVHNKEVSIEPEYREKESILDLVNSDNKLLSRILASLGSVCIEMNMLVEDAEVLYKQFTHYSGTQSQDLQNEVTFNFVLKTFESLQKVLSIVDQSQQVISLLLAQLHSVIGKVLYPSNGGSNFTECLDCLADLLVCLLILDNIVSEPIIKEHCCHFLIVIQTLLNDATNTKFSFESLQLLENNIREIQTTLLKENILKKVIQSCSTENICSRGLSSEFSVYITHLLLELECDEDHVYATNIWLKANALTAFHASVFGDIDKKLIKKLMDVNKKKSFCTIVETKLWYPDVFLSTHIPSFSKYYSLSSTKNVPTTTKNQQFLTECNSLCSRATLSMMNMDKITKKNCTNVTIEDIQEASNVYLATLKLIKKISELANLILRFHINQSLPIAKSTLLGLCRMIEVIKGFQFAFNRNLFAHIDMMSVISQHLTYKILSTIGLLKKKFVQEKSYKERQLDVLSTLSVCENAIKGPNTRERLLIAKLALSSSGLQMETCHEIKLMINRLSLFQSYHNTFLNICNCSFLYENIDSLMPIYFSKMLGSTAGISKYHLFMSALNDCSYVNEKMLTNFEVSIKEHFLNRVIQNVETKLRLQTHLHLELTPSNAFSDYISLKIFESKPAKLRNRYWSSKNEIEHYLSTTFYNLTTVVLHDWQTYGEMRKLAQLQYTLNTVDDGLPMQTIEQGLDVLEIMRNINMFVTNYVYNLNAQVFIEMKSNNKHLNTINISHITNSIRTHGFGIMNTTVNFTYQFLQKKFFTFSQFLFDEQIKSRLLKDLKFFSEHKMELKQMYPYERAERFNKGIRKLGLNDSEQSYLDLFRMLISHIGNAMGYVRLIRSGGRRCLAQGTCFIPDLKNTKTISDQLLNTELPPLTKKAASLFINEVNVLLENFEEATEYFKLLVDVFTPIFTDPKHIHLQNFFIIIPPLCVNFIEHSINFKEQLNKKNKDDSIFTDDGFAIGLAFIIELLKQEEQFNSLHWFQSVEQKFLLEEKTIAEQRLGNKKDDSKFLQTLALTERRIATYGKEFQLFYYTYKSARIFFQS